MEALREMRREGVPITLAVYNAVIDALAVACTMPDIDEVLESMQEDGIVPDLISWAIMVKGYCRRGDLNKALTVLQQASKKDVSAKESMIYNHILDGCIFHTRYDVADAVLRDMEEREVVPTNYTYGILVKLYARRRQIPKAYETIDNMSKKFGIAPNTQTCMCLMLACVTGHHTHKAMEIFGTLKAQGGADARICSLLIDGLVQHRQADVAVQVLEDAYGLTGQRCMPKGQYLEASVFEKLFTALGSRRLADRCGWPLLERLEAVAVPSRERLRAALMGNLSSKTNCRHSDK